MSYFSLAVCLALAVVSVANAQNYLQTDNVCNPNCVNGVCFQNQCLCRIGYSGKTCTLMCNPQCLNGGFCWLGTCLCRVGYSGPSCEFSKATGNSQLVNKPIFPVKPVNDCYDKVESPCTPECLNGGECVSGGKCKCKMPWTGEICQFRVYEIMNCDGDSSPRNCPSGEVIVIDAALYGRRDGDVDNCRGTRPHKKFPCGSYEQSIGLLRRECNRKKSCTFTATQDIYENHCFGIAKYLWARYHCEPEVIKPIGTWAEWAPWTDCSRTCGSGQRTRGRACDTLKEDKPCVGNSYENEVCAEQPCEGDADTYYWSSWSGFSQCSATCGQSFRQRSRNCVSFRDSRQVSPSNCGRGNTIEQQQCGVPASCSGGNVDLQWSAWNSPGACSVSCGPGGRQVRSRNCFLVSVEPSEQKAPSECVQQHPGTAATETTSCASSQPCSGRAGPRPDMDDVWGFEPYSSNSRYCQVDGVSPLKFMTLNDCADACFQWKVCRGITYDKDQQFCYPLKKFCDVNPELQKPNTQGYLSYRKTEEPNFACGQQKCEPKCQSVPPKGYRCAGNPNRAINAEVIDYDNSLVTDVDCARKCAANPECKSFQWGPSYTEYRIKNDYLPCTLFSVTQCTNIRTNSNTRHCEKITS